MKRGRKETKAAWQPQQTASFCQGPEWKAFQWNCQDVDDTTLFDVRWRGPFEGYR